MIHTDSIITLLKIQETRLNARIRKNKSASDQLTVIKISGIKLCNRILRNVCDTLWMMHLLKTSLLITKTPLTTLKCLLRSTFKLNLPSQTPPPRFPTASLDNSLQRFLVSEIFYERFRVQAN